MSKHITQDPWSCQSVSENMSNRDNKHVKTYQKYTETQAKRKFACQHVSETCFLTQLFDTRFCLLGLIFKQKCAVALPSRRTAFVTKEKCSASPLDGQAKTKYKLFFLGGGGAPPDPPISRPPASPKSASGLPGNVDFSWEISSSPGRPKADLGEAGGRRIGGVWGAEPPPGKKQRSIAVQR